MTEKPSAEVFRGHLDECAKHFADALSAKMPKGAKGLLKARMPLALFCGVSDSTLVRWLNHGDTPVGEALIKWMCYLDLIGYRIIELERMSKSLRNFAELIGFGLLTANEASQLLGYNSTQSLYRILHDSSHVGNGKERILWNTWKERREALEQKKEEARTHSLIKVARKTTRKRKRKYTLPKPAAPPAPFPPSAMPPLQPSSNLRIDAILLFMEGLLCLLKEEIGNQNSSNPSPGLVRFTQLIQDFPALKNMPGSQPLPNPRKEESDE